MYFNVVLLFFLVNGLASRVNCRLDLSRDQINSLTDSTQKVLARLKEPLLVEAYISQEVPGEILMLLQPTLSQLEEIGSVGKGKIQMRIVNPTSEESMHRAESRGIQGIPIEEEKVDEIKQRVGFFGVYVKMGEKHEVIPLVQDGHVIDDFEYRFLRSVKKMMHDNDERRFGIVRGTGTLDTMRWQQYSDQRKDNMYGFRTLAEQDLGPFQDVDLRKPVAERIRGLIVAGLPRLDDLERYNLDQFIMRGGNVIFLLKGFDFQLRESDPRLAQLGLGGPGGGYATVPQDDLRAMNEWLGHYGVTVNGEILLEPQFAVAAKDIQGRYVVPVANPAWAVYSAREGQIKSDRELTGPIEQLVFPWFSGLSIREGVQENVRYRVLVESSPSAIRRNASSLELRELQKVGESPADAKTMEAVPLAVVAKGKFSSLFSESTIPHDADRRFFRPGQAGGTESSLVVIGSPYLVSDILLRNELNAQMFRLNEVFLMNLLEVIAGDTDLLAARSRVHTLSVLSPLSSGAETVLKWVFTLFFPLLLALYGVLRLTQRNKRRGLETEKRGDA